MNLDATIKIIKGNMNCLERIDQGQCFVGKCKNSCGKYIELEDFLKSQEFALGLLEHLKNSSAVQYKARREKVKGEM